MTCDAVVECFIHMCTYTHTCNLLPGGGHTVPGKIFCCMMGEGLSGIVVINLYCHMWEGSFTRGYEGGNATHPSSFMSSLSLPVHQTH